MPLKISFLIPTDAKRKRCTRKHEGPSRGRESEGETWARAFTVVSVGRNEQGSVHSLGLDSWNGFSRLWGKKLSLVVWYLSWGD